MKAWRRNGTLSRGPGLIISVRMLLFLGSVLPRQAALLFIFFIFIYCPSIWIRHLSFICSSSIRTLFCSAQDHRRISCRQEQAQIVIVVIDKREGRFSFVGVVCATRVRWLLAYVCRRRRLLRQSWHWWLLLPRRCLCTNRRRHWRRCDACSRHLRRRRCNTRRRLWCRHNGAHR